MSLFFYFLKKFLNDEAKQNGTVDLEWLRDAPSDLVKYVCVDFFYVI